MISDEEASKYCREQFFSQTNFLFLGFGNCVVLSNLLLFFHSFEYEVHKNNIFINCETFSTGILKQFFISDI